MASVKINDVLEELSEENKRLANELSIAIQCIEVFNEFKCFIDLISEQFVQHLKLEVWNKFEQLSDKTNKILRALPISQPKNESPPESDSSALNTPEDVIDLSSDDECEPEEDKPEFSDDIRCLFSGCEKYFKTSIDYLNHLKTHSTAKPKSPKVIVSSVRPPVLKTQNVGQTVGKTTPKISTKAGDSKSMQNGQPIDPEDSTSSDSQQPVNEAWELSDAVSAFILSNKLNPKYEKQIQSLLQTNAELRNMYQMVRQNNPIPYPTSRTDPKTSVNTSVKPSSKPLNQLPNRPQTRLQTRPQTRPQNRPPKKSSDSLLSIQSAKHFEPNVSSSDGNAIVRCTSLSANYPMKCPFFGCGLTFFARDTYQSHMRSHPGITAKFVCVNCKFGFDTLEDLKDHSKTCKQRQKRPLVQRSGQNIDSNKKHNSTVVSIDLTEDENEVPQTRQTVNISAAEQTNGTNGENSQSTEAQLNRLLCDPFQRPVMAETDEDSDGSFDCFDNL